MSMDGNGTYTPPTPAFPAIPDTLIEAAAFNQIILDIAGALSQAIFRDGQVAFTANQSLGGFKLIRVANGVDPQDATTVLQVFTSPTFSDPTLSGDQVNLTAKTVDASTALAVKLPAGATGVTLPVGTSTNQLATMAALLQQAFSATLPNQAGNAGKFVTTDGANASWGTPLAIGSTNYLYVTCGGL